VPTRVWGGARVPPGGHPSPEGPRFGGLPSPWDEDGTRPSRRCCSTDAIRSGGLAYACLRWRTGSPTFGRTRAQAGQGLLVTPQLTGT